MGDPQSFKKFLCQKTVLDILRVYIDISEEFLRLIRKQEILADDELLIIEKLRWPSNRNEFLQALIKKTWKKEQFQAFLDILRDTQSQQLSEAMSTRVEQFLEDERAKEGEVMGTAGLKKKKPRRNEEERAGMLASQSRLDQFLKKNMTIQDHNAVRAMLREKDEEIHQMKIENTELRSQLKAKTGENLVLHNRLHLLDKAVTDLLAAVQFDTEHGNVQDAVTEIKSRLEEQAKLIKTLHEELNEKFKSENDMRNRISDLTNQNASLREIYETKDKENEKQRIKYETEIAKLKQRLDVELTNVFSWRKRHLQSQSFYQTTVSTMQTEINTLRAELVELKSKYDIVDKEFGKSKEELNQVNDKTRKLLATLDLDNTCDDTRVALDFARNVSYTRRRSSVNTAMVHARLAQHPNSRSVDSPFSASGSGGSVTPSDDASSTQSVYRLSVPIKKPNVIDFGSQESLNSQPQALLNLRRNSLPPTPRKRQNNGPSPGRRRSLFSESGIPIGSLPPIDGRDSPDVVSTPLH